MPTKTITSLQNLLVKNTVKLRDRRWRDAQGRFVIDGARELACALSAGVPLDAAFVCRPLCHTSACRDVLARLDRGEGGAEPIEVNEAVFGKLAYGERAEGVVAVAVTPRRGLAELSLPAQPLVAVLEGVEKPGNLGAVLRSADAAGVSAVIVAGGRTDLYNPNAVRASLGTIFTVPLCAATTPETITWLRERGCRLYAAQTGASAPYTAADFRGPAAIVLGNEAEGLSPAWSESGAAPICLPMLGAADSLNVSAAAAVLFYEALRQRRA